MRMIQRIKEHIGLVALVVLRNEFNVFDATNIHTIKCMGNHFLGDVGINAGNVN
jgi:hypothetical protein